MVHGKTLSDNLRDILLHMAQSLDINTTLLSTHKYVWAISNVKILMNVGDGSDWRDG